MFFEKPCLILEVVVGVWYPRRLTCYVEDLFRIQLLDIWVVTNQVWIAFLSWVSKFTEVYTSHLPPTSPHPFQANIKSRLLIVGQTLELQWGKFKFMPQRRDSVSHLQDQEESKQSEISFIRFLFSNLRFSISSAWFFSSVWIEMADSVVDGVGLYVSCSNAHRRIYWYINLIKIPTYQGLQRWDFGCHTLTPPPPLR